MVSITAFVIGIALNKPEISDDVSESALLNANLLEVSRSDSTEVISTTIQPKLADLSLVNFWATWCAPCRHEMPMFETVYQQALAEEIPFTIIGITIDDPELANPMLDDMGINYPVVYAESTGMELMSVIGNPQGLMPYSLLIKKDGTVLEQKIGRVHQEDIAGWIETYL
ncbi:MAG: TlpA disulfide reductase family protein [Pseudomonadota bacterium]